jgi:CPA2 family monovalent cation:H+ antiporter-2
MMEFVIAILAAFVGGLLVRKLKQPPLLGYLLAGIILGPSVLGLIGDTDRISVLAQIGVAFLMFQAGTSLSISEVRKLQGIALIGPWLLFVLMAPLVIAGVLWMDRSPTQISYLAVIVALSSTTVAIKLLAGRNELDTTHGRMAVAFSIVQDVPMIPALVIFGSLGAASQLSGVDMGWSIGISLAKAVGFVVVAFVVGAKVVPALLSRVSNNSELMLLAVIVIALGMAYVSNLMGISLVLGAFIAGLVVAESEVHFRVLKQLSPISDLFATFFFVSVGMLLDVQFVLSHLDQVILLVGLILLAKPLLLMIIGMIFKQTPRSAFLFGVALAQIGEEAFLLAQVGLTQGLIDNSSYSLVLSSAVLSIILSPVFMTVSGALLHGIERLPLVGRSFNEALGSSSKALDGMTGHIIICGYGHVGQELAVALEKRGVKYVVVDKAPTQLADLREKGAPYVLGDAAQESVLLRAGLERATSLAITVPSHLKAQEIVREARKVRRGISIVVRGVGSEDEVETLMHAGASEVIHPSFEASMGFLRSVLRGHGVSAREVDRTVSTRRVGFYG